MANTKLQKLNLLDKFLFDEAMEDRETYQAVISILLQNEVELLGKTETEKELRVSPELRQAADRTAAHQKYVGSSSRLEVLVQFYVIVLR